MVPTFVAVRIGRTPPPPPLAGQVFKKLAPRSEVEILNFPLTTSTEYLVHQSQNVAAHRDSSPRAFSAQGLLPTT